MATAQSLLKNSTKNRLMPSAASAIAARNTEPPAAARSISKWYNAMPTAAQAVSGGNPASSAQTAARSTYSAGGAATQPRSTSASTGNIFQSASVAQNTPVTPSATSNPAASSGGGVQPIPQDQPWSMGGKQYSPTDLQTMLNNPYVFAQEWLKGRGMDNPTMLARLGDFPEAAAPLIFMLLGDQPLNTTISAPTSASQFRRLLYQQTDPNAGGINAKQLINKLLSYGANDYGKDLLGAALGSGTPNEQVQFLNDLLNVATINSSPYLANPLRQATQYLGNQYLGAQLDANGGQQSYSEWLRNNGLFGVV